MEPDMVNSLQVLTLASKTRKDLAPAPLQLQTLLLAPPSLCSGPPASLSFLRPILEPIFFHTAFRSVIATLLTSCYPTLLSGIISFLICVLLPTYKHTPEHGPTKAEFHLLSSPLYPRYQDSAWHILSAHTLHFWLKTTFSSSQILTKRTAFCSRYITWKLRSRA